MSKPSAPKAPDPTVVAQAQTASNKDTAITQSELNNVDQTTPYGSSTFTQNGTYPDGTPKWSQATTLSPAQQSLLDMLQQGENTLGQTALGGLGAVQNSFGTPFSFGGPNVNGSVANSGNIATSLGNSGNVQTGVDASGIPQLQDNVQGGGNIQSALDANGVPIQGNLQNSGNVQTDLNTSGVPGLQSNIQGAGNVQNGLNLSGQPGLQSGVNNQYGGGITGRVNNGSNNPWAINQAENAAYNTQSQYLDPQFSRAHQSLNAQLANQGLSSGDRGYDAAQQVLGEQENQAYGNAGNQAVLAGQNEQNMLFGQGLAGANLQNSANAQGFTQGLAGADLANTANQQAYNQSLGTGQFQNAAQAQQYGQKLSSAQFQNTANQQGYNQALNTGQFQNTAQNQQFGQNLAAGQFQNAANQQGYQQNLGTGQFQNAAQAQQYGQNLSQGQFQNSANQQGLQNMLALGTFGNTAQNQQFNQNLAGAGFQNTAQGQQYNQNYANTQLNNAASQQALQQQLALRNQPLNEYNALASGSQVTLPQFNQVNPATMAGTNTAGITQNAYQNQLSAYQQQMAGYNNLFGLAGQLGSAAILA